MPKLYVICGHGAGDPGAVSGARREHQEADYVRNLAARIKALGGADVTVHNTAVNPYHSKTLGSLNVPSGTQVLELHMDSSGTGAARGAHVIIKEGLKPDAFDTKLAANLARIFPGRSKTIVGRSDLYAPNTAAKRGINYRMAEVGFINNITDRSIFTGRMDEVAHAILDAAGIASGKDGTEPKPEPAPTPTPSKPAAEKPARAILAVDGSWGQATTREMQRQLGTTPDGIVSRQPKANKSRFPGASSTSWKWLATGTAGGSAMVKALQRKVGTSADGWAGAATATALQKWLTARGYGVGGVDGYFGTNSVKALQRALNDEKFK